MNTDLISKLLRLAAQWEAHSADVCLYAGAICHVLCVNRYFRATDECYVATLDGATGTGSTRAEALVALSDELEARNGGA